MEFTGSTLRDSLNAELQRGIDLVRRLDDDIYCAKPGNSNSIGMHFRHNADFATSFLKGVDTGLIDFTDRERDLNTETDREYAIDALESTVAAICTLDEKALGRSVLVRSEVDESLWLGSTVLRELEFLHSHTVHHYALIAAKLKALNIDSEPGFGVAPSTLKYWSSKIA